MKPDISEFSYGYALTEDLLTWAGAPVTAAPVFPSLIAEGQPGGGFDVRLEFQGLPLFLQFKLSDYMVRRTAKETALGLMQPPFYRMHIRPSRHSHQHELLLALEGTGCDVYYAVPVFHTPNELNESYLHHRTVQNSRFFRPSSIGKLPDDRTHHVAFDNSSMAWLLSEPVEIGHPISSQQLARILSGRFTAEESHVAVSSRLSKILSDMVRILSDSEMEASPFSADDVRSDRSVLSRIAFLAQTMFGCAFFFVKSRENEAQNVD